MLALAGAAAAHPHEPFVQRGMFEGYDVEALKAGEWVEYEEEVMEEPSRCRMACIAVKDGTAWIEFTGGEKLARWSGSVLRLAVDRKSRQVTEAVWGWPGEKVREVAVYPLREPAPKPEPDAAPKKDETPPAAPEEPPRKGKAVVEAEEAAVGDKKVACEKLSLDYTTAYPTGEARFISRTWTSASVPFRFSQKVEHLSALDWKGKPSWPGGLVKREIENAATGKVQKLELTAWGTDARETLKAGAEPAK